MKMWKRIILLFLLFQVVKSSSFSPPGSDCTFTLIKPLLSSTVTCSCACSSDTEWCALGFGIVMSNSNPMVAYKNNGVCLKRYETPAYDNTFQSSNQNGLTLTNSNTNGEFYAQWTCPASLFSLLSTSMTWATSKTPTVGDNLSPHDYSGTKTVIL
ncbi:hypothetical protein Glove_266g22 [Diversispora epigaea]|uniref:Uncharacterized protein n=1 Tax=Diversispora epigaea TaxID=1348612 RepID=A0A397I975_9GLOM|nr:hypothetical protein Glove_266g22 [Diversispora epigaea]